MAKQKSQLLKSSSFSWDKAFFTSEGVLDEDELSSIIEGDCNNVKKHDLPPIPDIDNLEAELLQKIELASTKTSNKIKIKTQTQPTTSRHNSPLNNPKSPTTISRITTRSKPGRSKSKSDLQSHLSPRTSSPSSPSSPRSPSFSINQRSPRGSSTSVPRRSSSTNARRYDEQKPGKPYKSPPVIYYHPSSPLGLPNSSSTTSLSSSSLSSSAYKKVNQRSISTGRRATTSAHHKSLNRDSSATSSVKTRPTTTQAPDHTPKGRKIQATKTVETILKPNPQRSSSLSRPSSVVISGKERGSSSSASRGVRNIFLVSPEVLDMKGKLNALKMEINMQKKDKCKETKMVPVKIGKSESSSSIFKNSSSKMNNQARRT